MIDSVHVERLILVNGHDEATRVMRSRPDNVISAYTRDGDKVSITDAGSITFVGFKAYGNGVRHFDDATTAARSASLFSLSLLPFLFCVL